MESFSPVKFKSYQLSEFTTTIPKNTPPGEYLARIEQIALHLGTGVPEIFVSCAQIKVTGSGTGNPSKVSIPGYIKANGTSPSRTFLSPQSCSCSSLSQIPVSSPTSTTE